MFFLNNVYKQQIVDCFSVFYKQHIDGKNNLHMFVIYFDQNFEILLWFNGVIKIFFMSTPVAMATKFEAELTITESVYETTARFFSNREVNVVNCLDVLQ